MLPLLLATTTVDRTEEVVGRLTQFLKSLQTLSVEFTIRPPGGGPGGRGRLVFQRPNSTRFDLKIPSTDYSFTATSRGTLEILRSGKLYDEDRPAQNLGFPPPGITRVNEFAFPLLLISVHPRQAVSDEAAFSWAGQATVGGAKTDHLVAKWNGRSGVGEAHFYVDSAGKPVRFNWRAAAEDEMSGAAMEFSNFQVNQPPPPGIFNLTVPNGFVPFSLPYHVPSPDPGMALPASRWNSTAGGTVDLASQIRGKALLFFSAPGCAPSDQLRAELGRVASDLDIPVIELSVDGRPSSSSSAKLWTDDPGVFERMGIDGSPTILAVNGGKVGRTWYGYSPNQKKLLRETLKSMVDDLD